MNQLYSHRKRSGLRMQHEDTSRGGLQVTVLTEDGTRPVEDAVVRISYTGEPDRTVEEVKTDSSGQTPVLELKSPPLEYSMEPSEEQPYAEYTIQIQAEGFEREEIAGTEVLPDVLAQQPVRLRFQSRQSFDRIVIGPHNGPVGDQSAGNYYVRYKDYIKNVASSEIYATWPDDTIRANVLAIMSFTLNRVYTEWYRNKGYDFTITSSTAYDHKWIYGRNVFDSISRIVDELFENYLSRPDVRQPILTQYCDGQRVQCRDRGWMTQWGSKTLGDQGYSPIEILRYFYGDDMYINVAEEVSGVPASWPGYDLDIGATGAKVRQLQEQINTISRSYPAVPSINADGIYGQRTADAVRRFQGVFGLPETGITDYPTWYKIQEIYVAVSRIAELN